MKNIMTNEEKRLYAIYKNEAEPLVTAWDFGVREMKKASCCPLHNDSKPSFTVFKSNEGNLMFKCHSQCGAGDYLKFMEKRDGLNRKDALLAILAQFGVDPNAKKNTASSGSSAVGSSSSNGQDDDVIAAKVDEMNKAYAIVKVGGDAKVMMEYVSSTTNELDIDFGTVSSVKTLCANEPLLLPSGRIIKNTIDMWLVHPKRRTYLEIVFDPSSTNGSPKCYNLWKGFAVKPDANAYCNLYIAHIRDVVANGDEKVFKYLLDWMADAVQNPAKLPGVAIAIRGIEGSGKGTLINNYCKIFGRHSLHVTNKNQFLSNFNFQLKECLMLYADEAFWSGDKQLGGNLKALITEEKRVIEKKGVDAFTVRNYTRLLMSSNDSWIAPTDIGCRRFCILDCPDHKVGDFAYFEAIEEEMANGGVGALLHFLLQRDLSGVNIREFPRTKAMLDNTERSMDTVQKYWYNHLLDARKDLWLESRKVDEIYEEYTEFVCSEESHSRPVNKIAFGKSMKEVCPLMEKKRKSQMSGNPNCYFFPTLAKCRRLFEDKLKMKVEWDEEDVVLEHPFTDGSDEVVDEGLIPEKAKPFPVPSKLSKPSQADDEDFHDLSDVELAKFLNACTKANSNDNDSELDWSGVPKCRRLLRREKMFALLSAS
jgi:hypothetical protein